MTLNSFGFIPFISSLVLILLIVQWMVCGKNERLVRRIQIYILLFSGIVFLSTYGWKAVLWVLLATVVSYITGRMLQKNCSHKMKRWILVSGIGILVFTLCFFKYVNWVLNYIWKFSHQGGTLDTIIFPIGMSFYVFSAISYMVDVYRKQYAAVQNLADYALYISFFPKLISGPIVRANDFLPQIKNYRGVTQAGFSAGIQIFVFGLFKKFVLADRLAIFVNDVFYAPSAYNTATVLLAIVSYSLQIYYDFSGYSDMAIGISKILGFDFLSNFNLPYMANGISDFWRRWHISLSSWFRDYVYFPLGGSRCSIFRVYFNLLIVMVISGIWHGVGVTFLVWGALHGVLSCIEHYIKERDYKIPKIVNILVTYILVSLLWVFFRADSIENAVDVLHSAFTAHTGINQMYIWSFGAIIVLVLSSCVAFYRMKKLEPNGQLKGVPGFYPLMDLTKFWPLVIFFVMAGCILLFGYFRNTTFIYQSF